MSVRTTGGAASMRSPENPAPQPTANVLLVSIGLSFCPPDCAASDHAGEIHDGAQARELVLDEVLEVLAAGEGGRPAVLLQRFLPRLALGGLGDGVDQRGALL